MVLQASWCRVLFNCDGFYLNLSQALFLSLAALRQLWPNQGWSCGFDLNFWFGMYFLCRVCRVLLKEST